AGSPARSRCGWDWPWCCGSRWCRRRHVRPSKPRRPGGAPRRPRAGWCAGGTRGTGPFVYGSRPDEHEVSDDYNNTRHAGVLGALYALGRVDAADAGLRYVREHLLRRDDWTAFAPPGESVSVGANALVVVALMERWETTGERRYDRLARRIGRFLVSQQQTDGRILQYWQRYLERSLPGVYGTFAT